MSKEIIYDINNVVDKEKSKYYIINKNKRIFWHSKSVTISCRIREKDRFNSAREMAINTRAFLLNEDEKFSELLNTTMNLITLEDQKVIRNYIYALFPNVERQELDKNIGLYINSLPEGVLNEALQLEQVVSCRLLGYEKELFFLKCYIMGFLPVFVLRCLYHMKYDHLPLKNSLENDNDLLKGIAFERYLEKIKFI